MLTDLLLNLSYTTIPVEIFHLCFYIDELTRLIMLYFGDTTLTYFQFFFEMLWTWLQKPEILGSEIDYLTTRGEEIMMRLNATHWELVFNILFPPTVLYAISISFKFILGIACLIFARGGIPRFRFDYLTKLGWIRFLSLVLVSFLVQILILALN